MIWMLIKHRLLGIQLIKSAQDQVIVSSRTAEDPLADVIVI